MILLLILVLVLVIERAARRRRRATDRADGRLTTELARRTRARRCRSSIRRRLRSARLVIRRLCMRPIIGSAGRRSSDTAAGERRRRGAVPARGCGVRRPDGAVVMC